MVKWSERHDKDIAYKGGFDPRLFDDWEMVTKSLLGEIEVDERTLERWKRECGKSK